MTFPRTQRNLKFALPLGLIAVTGCEKPPAPTAAGKKKAIARTATGTKFTRLEVSTQPENLVAGGVTILELKVFGLNDDENHRRTEWSSSNQRQFAEMPDSPERNISQRLMRAWLVGEKNSFLTELHPVYKEYGNFLGDFTPPANGKYAIFSEYLIHENGREYPREHACKVLTVGPDAGDSVADEESAPLEILKPSPINLKDTRVYDDSGRLTEDKVQLTPVPLKARKSTTLAWKLPATATNAENPEIIAVSPGGQALLHFAGLTPTVTLPTSGPWRLWFTYNQNEKFYSAPYPVKVQG